MSPICFCPCASIQFIHVANAHSQNGDAIVPASCPRTFISSVGGMTWWEKEGAAWLSQDQDYYVCFRIQYQWAILSALRIHLTPPNPHRPLLALYLPLIHCKGEVEETTLETHIRMADTMDQADAEIDPSQRLDDSFWSRQYIPRIYLYIYIYIPVTRYKRTAASCWGEVTLSKEQTACDSTSNPRFLHDMHNLLTFPSINKKGACLSPEMGAEWIMRVNCVSHPRFHT